MSIEPDRDDATDVRWQGELRVLGVIGAVGQRALPLLAREQVGDVLRAACSLGPARRLPVAVPAEIATTGSR